MATGHLGAFPRHHERSVVDVFAISRVVLPPWGGCRRDYAEAFIAGFMPEGRGSVAFPVLNVFLHVDRVLARDFSMMIQSIGMTSAVISILSQKDTVVNDYKPFSIWATA
jgi:hypothetical protein